MAAPLLQSTLLAELFFAGVPILVATIQPLACLFDTSVCVPACLPACLPGWLQRGSARRCMERTMCTPWAQPSRPGAPPLFAFLPAPSR
jgi:hypothetical protein